MFAPTTDMCDTGQVTTELLPDLVLLEIFDFYVAQAHWQEEWIALVHVCRRWRDIVFGSPRRLNLHLLYTGTDTEVLRKLDIWPPLPIAVVAVRDFDLKTTLDVRAIVEAVAHDDRIDQIKLHDTSSFYWPAVLAAMQKPFPVLTDLALEFDERTHLIVPDSFLGGSAPDLRSLSLKSIQLSFPALRKLLLSATDLVELRLWNDLDSAYFSPKGIAACLSALTRLKIFDLGFDYYSPLHDQDSRRLPRPTRIALLALTSLSFEGDTKYLEDLLSRIDAPILEDLNITYFHQVIFNTTQLAQFIGRTPKFMSLSEAYILFDRVGGVFVSSRPWSLLFHGFGLRVRCLEPNWQLSTLAQLCNSPFIPTLVSTVEHLYIQQKGSLKQSHLLNDRHWLEILHPFTAVKTLYLSKGIASRLASVLQGLVGERAMELLPALQTVYVEGLVLLGHVEEAINQFSAVRRLGSNSVAVCPWIDTSEMIDIK